MNTRRSPHNGPQPHTWRASRGIGIGACISGSIILGISLFIGTALYDDIRRVLDPNTIAYFSSITFEQMIARMMMAFIQGCMGIAMILEGYHIARSSDRPWW